MTAPQNPLDELEALRGRVGELEDRARELEDRESFYRSLLDRGGCTRSVDPGGP
jgi:hypothetical protein